MTWVGYVIFFVIFGGLLAGLLCYMPGGPRFHLPKRKPRAEVDPWADWKEIAANVKSLHEAEHKSWQDDFNRLVQATCAHSYPATSSNPTYYTCLKCKYEEPWDEPHEGCKCQYEQMNTLLSPFPVYEVTYRAIDCKWHGVDWPINQRTDRSNRPFSKESTRRSWDRWEDVFESY